MPALQRPHGCYSEIYGAPNNLGSSKEDRCCGYFLILAPSSVFFALVGMGTGSVCLFSNYEYYFSVVAPKGHIVFPNSTGVEANIIRLKPSFKHHRFSQLPAPAANASGFLQTALSKVPPVKIVRSPEPLFVGGTSDRVLTFMDRNPG